VTSAKELTQLSWKEQSTAITNHPLVVGDTNQAWEMYTENKLPVFVDSATKLNQNGTPLVGITMSLVEEKFVARKRYADEITNAGGRPVFVPHVDVNCAEEYLENLDALVLSGGGDLHPDCWGAKLTQAGQRNQIIDKNRDEFELKLAQVAIDNGIPTLGVCRGMQVINVALGGTLLQSLPSWRTHMPDSNDYAGMINNHHRILLGAQSKLASMARESLNQVNSGHHMAIYELGKNLKIGAIAYDRTVEAIEGANEKKYLIGVQWHPEAMIGNRITHGLFGELVSAVKRK